MLQLHQQKYVRLCIMMAFLLSPPSHSFPMLPVLSSGIIFCLRLPRVDSWTRQQSIAAQNTERTSSAVKAWVRLPVPTSFFHEPSFTAQEVLSGAHIHIQEQKGEIRSARSASSLLRITSSGIHPDATPKEVHGHRRDITRLPSHPTNGLTAMGQAFHNGTQQIS